MRLMRETRSVFGGADIWRKYEWALGLLSLISSCFAISVAPFVRKDFGERYFGWINLFFGYSIMANFMFFSSLIGILVRQNSMFPQLMTYFWFAFVGLSLYHRWQISRRNKAGVEWHSMYIGTSLLPLPLGRENIYKFAEPAVVFFAGHYLYGLCWQVGLWLMLGAAGLFVNNHIVYYNERQNILDLRDAQIEAKYLSGALTGKPPRETGGFVVAESTIKLMGKDAHLQSAFSNLSSELNSLLDSPPDSTSGSPA
jgi:hypothetical protein